jgi:glucose/arabinose dehydrogenase
LKNFGISIFASIFFLLCVFSSMIIIILPDDKVVYAMPSDNQNGSAKTKFYACEDYGKIFHCDPTPNKLKAFSIKATFSKVYPVTSEHPVYVEGKQNKALELKDKNREYVEVSNTSSFNSPHFSVSFWIKKISDTSPHGHVISYVNNKQTAGWYFDVTTLPSSSSSTSSTSSSGKVSDQTLRFIVSNNASNNMIKSKDIPLSPSAFVHIVGTFDGSVAKVYRDGILVDKLDFKGKFNADPKVPLHIGSAAYCSSCVRWSGDIDDARFYNRAIGDNEVREIFSSNSSKGDVLDGLVGRWTFDGDLKDKSGQNNQGRMFTPMSSMAFAPDGRLFFSEKNTGQIRIMKDNNVLQKPFATISDVYVNWEQGLLGLTIDPNFMQNHFIYLYYTALDNKTNHVINRVVRFTENDNTATDKVIILDNIPASVGFHSGGALAFGPDDKLYITVGDATEHEFAQDPSILIGKVLRINRDGTIPQDNPFPNSPIYTLGHRNMYGIAFDMNNGSGVVTENGDTFYDELNLIQKGGNYGFPLYQPANIAPELSNSSSSIKPLRSYWTTIAPTQEIYYNADKIPSLKGKFLFGTFTGDIYAVGLNYDKDIKKQIIEDEQHININQYPFEPVIGIAQSPDGNIYFGSYNIYKLDSVNTVSKKQDTFTIELTSSPDVNINDLQASDIKKYVSINLHRNSSNDGNGSSLAYPVLKVKIPTGLLDKISTVNAVNIDRSLAKELTTYAIDNSSSALGYNIINVRLTPGASHLQLTINGTTTTTTTAATSATTTKTTAASPTTALSNKLSSSNPLYDDFENSTYTLTDGQTSPNKKWQNIYNGGGSSGVKEDAEGKNVLFMYPKASITDNETHANLVKSTSQFSDFDMIIDAKTVKQLRQNTPPKPWEAAWIFFRFTDNFHHYWFVIKSSGVELGKKDCDTCTNSDQGQIFLYSNNNPSLKVGEWSTWEVKAIGNHISIAVNGTQVVDFTDAGMSRKLAKGSIGLYDEDADVNFDNVHIKPIKAQR